MSDVKNLWESAIEIQLADLWNQAYTEGWNHHVHGIEFSPEEKCNTESWVVAGNILHSLRLDAESLTTQLEKLSIRIAHDLQVEDISWDETRAIIEEHLLAEVLELIGYKGDTK